MNEKCDYTIQVKSYAFCETKIHPYNNCENAKLFVKLTGRGYLINSDLELINKLGYNIQSFPISQHNGVPESELISETNSWCPRCGEKLEVINETAS